MTTLMMSADVELPYCGDDPATLIEIVRRILMARAEIGRTIFALERCEGRLVGCWRGPGASAFQQRLGAAREWGSASMAAVDRGGQAVTDLAGVLELLRYQIDSLRSCWIENDRGRIAAVAAGVPEAPFDAESARLRLAWSRVRDRADEAAGYCSRQLQGLASELDSRGSSAGFGNSGSAGSLGLSWGAGWDMKAWAGLPADVQNFLLSAARQEKMTFNPCDLADRQKHWAALNPIVRQAYLHAQPQQFGNVDGLPAADRDLANRLTLAADVDRARPLLDKLGVAADFDPTDQAQADGVRSALIDSGVSAAESAALIGILNIQRQLDRAEEHYGGSVPVQLLVYSPEMFAGQGRAAIAIGDVSNSAHVAMTVPGMGSDVPGYLDNQMTNAMNLHGQIAANYPGTPTAVVASISYDTPAVNTSVGSIQMAEHGQSWVSRDLAGLAAMRIPAAGPAHVTVVAHSYGSLTATIALTKGGGKADDLVLIGSPGVGAGARADQFVAGAAHVWVGSASSDPVTTVLQTIQAADNSIELGGLTGFAVGKQFGPLQALLGAGVGASVMWLAGDPGSDLSAPIVDADLGQDPASEVFGGQRFHAEVDSDFQLDFGNHSLYYAPGSESLDNISAVVTGNYDDVGLAPQRSVREHYLLSDPESAHVPK